MRRIGGIALFASALLCGCAGYSDIHTESRPVSLKKISPEFSLQAQWWTLFGDDQLDGLIREALADSPDIKVAQARIRLARSLVMLSGADLYPQVYADGSAVRERISATGYFPPPLGGSTLNFAQLTLGLDYDLDWWGRNKAALNAALSDKSAEEAESRETGLALGTAIAQSYFRLQAGLLKLDISRHILTRQEALLELLKFRAKNGIDSDLRIHEEESQVASTRLAISAVEEDIRLNRGRIAALLGKPPERGDAILARIDSPPRIPEIIPADMIGMRPDIVAQRSRIAAASSRIREARAEFYPNIDLSAYAGVQSIGFGSLLEKGSEITSFGPAIHLPIFGGGRLRANLKARDAEYDIAVENYNKMVIRAMQDVHDASTSLKSVTDQISEQNEVLLGLQKAHAIAAARYREGIGDELSVLESEMPLLSQKNTKTDLDERRMETILEMIKSLGGAPSSNPG